MKTPKPHSTVVLGRWIVLTGDTGTDLSNGESKVPLTWVTTVTDQFGKWTKQTMRRYPTADAARRGHNSVVKHLKGGGNPNNFNQ
jgi:hypothetical protein